MMEVDTNNSNSIETRDLKGSEPEKEGKKSADSNGSSNVFIDTNNSNSNEMRDLKGSESEKEGKKSADGNGSSNVFVNHAAIAWHENRRMWIGDQSRKTGKKPKEPLLSWSMTYEELTSTNDPFPDRIPLAEMVDFLVDMWHDEDLYD